VEGGVPYFSCSVLSREKEEWKGGGTAAVLLFGHLQRDRRVREGVCQGQLSSSVLSREKGDWGGGGQPKLSCSVLSREKGEGKWVGDK
jgi:hypothetical protein